MQPLPVAMEQFYAHRGLQLLDPGGDGRRHAMQFACGPDHAALVDDALEHL